MCLRMSCANGCVVALDWYLPRVFSGLAYRGAGVLMYALCLFNCSPEDGYNDARNILRQNLIINIFCCILLVFSLHILITMHGHRNLKLIYTLDYTQMFTCSSGMESETSSV